MCPGRVETPWITARLKEYPDPKAAYDLLERAAEAGLPTAQYDLAEMMLNGEVGEPDPKGAIPWLTQAAAAHHPIAEYRLGQWDDAVLHAEVARSIAADLGQIALVPMNTTRAPSAAAKHTASPPVGIRTSVTVG